MLYYNGKEMKDFQIDYERIYNALTCDRDDSPVISNEEYTKANNGFDEFYDDLSEILTKKLPDESSEILNDLCDAHYPALDCAEVLGFEVGIKFALGLITQNNLIKCKDDIFHSPEC